MVKTNSVLSGTGTFNTGLIVNYPGAGNVTTNSVTIAPVQQANGDALIIGNLQVTGSVYANSKQNVYGTFTPTLYANVNGTNRTCTLVFSNGSYSRIWNGTNYTTNLLINIGVNSYIGTGNINDLWICTLPVSPTGTSYYQAGCVMPNNTVTNIPFVCDPQAAQTITTIGSIPASLHVNVNSSIVTTQAPNLIYISYTYFS